MPWLESINDWRATKNIPLLMKLSGYSGVLRTRKHFFLHRLKACVGTAQHETSLHTRAYVFHESNKPSSRYLPIGAALIPETSRQFASTLVSSKDDYDSSSDPARRARWLFDGQLWDLLSCCTRKQAERGTYCGFQETWWRALWLDIN